MKVLLTGGAGYIGTHTAVALVAAGHEPVLVDNYYNSAPEAVHRLEKIVGQKVKVYQLDCTQKAALQEVFEAEKPEAVIHFAGYKAVGESVSKPLQYYRNNLDSLLTVLEVMEQCRVTRIVFSSSATVYGVPEHVPLSEEMPTSAVNPYGQTKLMCEQILTDAAAANPQLSTILLRYFNPVGAHESGSIGEDPNDIPNNLMPYIAQVAVGRRAQLTVHGGDYPTSDGTGVRDYIHVMDLAQGHLCALQYAQKNTGVGIFNLGTGKPASVLDMVAAFEKASGKPIPYVIGPRRAGDVAECYADSTKANQALNWSAQYDVQRMCEDTWRWQLQNPFGYGKEESGARSI